MEKLFDIFLLMLDGTQITLEIFFVTLLLSLPLGMMAALGRLSSLKIISRIVEFYIWIMRGTPLMLQLLFVYFALPMIGIRLPDIAAALLAFTLNYAAYFAEIFRGGIEAIPKGQYEAAEILGYGKTQTFFRIILPQVIKTILPSVTNEVITLVKDTSMAFTLAYNEMFSLAKQIAASQTSFMPFVIAGVFYFIANYVVAFVMEFIEKKLSYYR